MRTPIMVEISMKVVAVLGCATILVASLVVLGDASIVLEHVSNPNKISPEQVHKMSFIVMIISAIGLMVILSRFVPNPDLHVKDTDWTE